ncbi:MAG TPA: tetratricopeptide repeat protein [Pyrinomonadaceae bacterium]|nr:tetratricopeptide repeat protein [Pyrinomonadaceae bacterium]
MRSSHIIWDFLLAFVLLIIHAGTVQGQGGHTLFGDLQVDETKVEGFVSLSFDVVLYTEGGVLLGRQTVVNNSRYRFLNLQDGRYDVVVEVEGSEVARVRVLVKAAYKTDFRQDIHLEWREGVARRQRAKAQTISAADFYDRTGRNKSLFEKAQKAVDEKKFDEAVDFLNRLVAADAKDFQAWTELGTVQLMLNNIEEAEKAYRRAIQERPKFMLALLNLGRLLSSEQKFEAAIEPLTEAVKLSATSAEANFLLGEAYLQIKKGSKAVPYLIDAAKLGKAEAHLRLAALYNAVGLKEKAAIEYEQFLKKRPDYKDRKTLEQYISENKKP